MPGVAKDSNRFCPNAPELRSHALASPPPSRMRPSLDMSTMDSPVSSSTHTMDRPLM